MEKIIRKSIAFDGEELRAFDKVIRQAGYSNRSEAIRDLVRARLVDSHIQDPKRIMAATLSYVYNHHEHDVLHELTHLQHDHGEIIRSSTHVHMDHDMCLETVVLYGPVSEIKSLAGRILSAKGVKHGQLFLTEI